MTNMVLAALARASVEGVLVITVVFVLTRALPRLPAAARCALWWLAAFRMLWTTFPLPSLPALTLTTGAVPAPVQRVASALADRALFTTHAVSAASSRAAPDSRTDAPSGSLGEALLAIWAAGCLSCIGLHARSARRLARTWRAATPIDATPLLQGLDEVHGGRIELRASDAVGAPLVMGWSRPRILVPSSCLALDPSALRMALAHEASHIRRRDLVWGTVPTLAECIFWFHPLAHFCGREYVQAREEACDGEAVQRTAAPLDRYGDLLVGFGVDGARLAHAAASCGSPHVRQLRRRLRMLAIDRHRTRAERRVALGLVLATGLTAIAPVRLFAAFVVEPSRTGRSSSHTTTTTATNTAYAESKRVSSSSSNSASSDGDYSYSYATDADDGDDTFAYGIVRGGDNMMSGSFGSFDWKAIERAGRRSSGEFAWFHVDGESYVVRDRDTIRRIEAILGPQSELGRRQGELGGKQGELGAEQGELGRQQGELGQREARLGQRVTEIEIKLDSDRLSEDERRDLYRQRRQLDDEIRALSRRQRDLGEQQRELGGQQRDFGERQSDLGRQQRRLVRRAHEQMRELAHELVQQGHAERVE